LGELFIGIVFDNIADLGVEGELFCSDELQDCCGGEHLARGCNIESHVGGDGILTLLIALAIGPKE
jgi:hypothetical protein